MKRKILVQEAYASLDESISIQNPVVENFFTRKGVLVYRKCFIAIKNDFLYADFDRPNENLIRNYNDYRQRKDWLMPEKAFMLVN